VSGTDGKIGTKTSSRAIGGLVVRHASFRLLRFAGLDLHAAAAPCGEDESRGRARNGLKKRAPDSSVVSRFLETK